MLIFLFLDSPAVSALAVPLAGAAAAAVTSTVGFLDPVWAVAFCFRQRQNPWFHGKIAREWLRLTASPLARQGTLRSIVLLSGMVGIVCNGAGEDAYAVLRTLPLAVMPLTIALAGILICLSGCAPGFRRVLWLVQHFCVFWSATQAAAMAVGWMMAR